MEASPRPSDRQPAFGASRLLVAQPDAVLCRLAARGVPGAYEALYERYRTPITAFVFHLLGRGASAEDAEDIAQDTFVRAFAGVRERRVDGSFKAWLYAIARNRTIDLHRGARERVASLDAEETPQPAAPESSAPESSAERRAELTWLVGAVAELPERQREALLMKELGGLSHERIAAELDTTVSATKKLIGRGRDGIARAAIAGGYRTNQRRLGRDLALAAPIVPLAATLASLGVVAGAGAGAGAGGAAIGKIAATVLAVAAIGGGTVAVEKKVASGQGASAADAAAPDRPGAPPPAFMLAASSGAVALRGASSGEHGDDDDRDADDRDDRDDDRGDDRDDDRGDRRDDDSDSIDRDEADDDAAEAKRESRQRGRDRDDRDDDDDAVADRPGSSKSDSSAGVNSGHGSGDAEGDDDAEGPESD